MCARARTTLKLNQHSLVSSIFDFSVSEKHTLLDASAIDKMFRSLCATTATALAFFFFKKNFCANRATSLADLVEQIDCPL